MFRKRRRKRGIAEGGGFDQSIRDNVGAVTDPLRNAQANEKVIVDRGAPLNAKKMVTAQGVEDFTDAMTGYAIVEADSHDEAVRIFSGHPHLGLSAGNSIAVLQCPSPPG